LHVRSLPPGDLPLDALTFQGLVASSDATARNFVASSPSSCSWLRDINATRPKNFAGPGGLSILGYSLSGTPRTLAHPHTSSHSLSGAPRTRSHTNTHTHTHTHDAADTAGVFPQNACRPPPCSRGPGCPGDAEDANRSAALCAAKSAALCAAGHRHLRAGASRRI